MASSASTSNLASGSSSIVASEEEPRSQAGPLPRKRGEIGFREDLHKETEGQGSSGRDGEASLPVRHPADRDNPTASGNVDSPGSSNPLPHPPAPTQTDDTSSFNSAAKHSLISCFRRETIYGLRPSSFLVFIVQVLFLVGTVVGWAFTAIAVNKASRSSTDPSQQENPTSNSSIFVHVAFAIVVLSQLLFLERSIFRLRGERYYYLHPGAILPRSMGFGGESNDTRLPFAPWQRPPLPTYAAALAETGHGTGDVEDNIIAVPPPPAYGNTRGSMLLLSGFLRKSLRAQVREQRTSMTVVDDRPVSYMSHDSSWEVVVDAGTARRLEETLSHLEQGRGDGSVSSSS